MLYYLVFFLAFSLLSLGFQSFIPIFPSSFCICMFHAVCTVIPRKVFKLFWHPFLNIPVSWFFSQKWSFQIENKTERVSRLWNRFPYIGGWGWVRIRFGVLFNWCSFGFHSLIYSRARDSENGCIHKCCVFLPGKSVIVLVCGSI